eukprot:TRINITY_DN1938_c0_g1_i1.p1 TRINITY_DN1938_c0_g1~~TRINITY_DN1938_c0_g1_i1.p1  ORF type:complete len:280 (+),score=60.97 TRINITY_DN1938_c0_g1_i1:36-842(+)
MHFTDPRGKGDKACFHDLIRRQQKRPTSNLLSLEKIYAMNKAKEERAIQKANRSQQEQRISRHREQKEKDRLGRVLAKEHHFNNVDSRARKRWHDELEGRYQTDAVIQHRQGITTLNKAARIGEVSHTAWAINRAKAKLISELKHSFEDQACSTIDIVANRSGLHPPNAVFSSTVCSKKPNTASSQGTGVKPFRVVSSTSGGYDAVVAHMPSLRMQSPAPSPQKSFSATTTSTKTYGKLTKEAVSAAEEWIKWDRVRCSSPPASMHQF